jgi:glucuronate isomerase
MDSELTGRLALAVDKIPVVDIHSRVDAEDGSAMNAADAVLHTEIKSALLSAGVSPKVFDEDNSAADMLRRSLPKLSLIKNTSAYQTAAVILRDLYGIDELDESAADSESPDAKETLEKANVERVIGSVNWWMSVSEAENSKVAPGLRLDSLINEPHQQRTVDRLGEATGESVYEAADLRMAIKRLISDAADSGCRAISAAFNPRVTFERGNREAADRVLSLVVLGQRTNADDLRTLRSFVLSSVLEAAAENEMTFQLILGRVQPVAGDRSLPAFEPELLRNYTSIFVEHSGVNFDILLANTVHSQELAVIAGSYPNVYASGYGSFSSSPTHISRMLRERIEMLPMTRSCALFSAAPNAEWVYGDPGCSAVC